MKSNEQYLQEVAEYPHLLKVRAGIIGQLLLADNLGWLSENHYQEIAEGRMTVDEWARIEALKEVL